MAELAIRAGWWVALLFATALPGAGILVALRASAFLFTVLDLGMWTASRRKNS
jgi:hypothetical protein